MDEFHHIFMKLTAIENFVAFILLVTLLWPPAIFLLYLWVR